MTNADFEEENTQLLLSMWERVRSGANPTTLGISAPVACALSALDKRQVVRAATVHKALFSITPQDVLLENALKLERTDNTPDPNTFTFLVNRWRASSGSFQFCQMYFGMSRRVYDLFKAATFPRIQAAAASGADLMVLAIKPPYLTHSGTRFDLDTAQRTRLAICNTAALGY